MVRQRMSRMMMHKGWRTVVRLFRAWKLTVHSLRKRRFVARQWQVRRDRRQQRQVLRQWFIVAQLERRKQRIMRVTLARIVHVKVTGAFYHWRAVARSATQAEARSQAVSEVRSALRDG